MRAPIAYLRKRATTPPPFVPRMAPEVYAGRVFGTGRGGTVTVLADGTGTVHDEDGRYRTTLPAHTVAQLVTRATD